jgi:pimeloyl-ACP methyl ester carboxylesterase
MAQNIPDTAMRRIKLQFDKNGDLSLPSCMSPESFKVDALAVLPPHDVIPVIFVPGVAGSNLKTGTAKTWNVPNGAGDLGTIGITISRTQPKRQNLFDPLKAEVSPDGPCAMPEGMRWNTPEEAKRRGWGEIHAGSYHGFLQTLEAVLNDMTTDPGVPDAKANFLLPEIGMMEYLDGGRRGPEHDYGLKAEGAMAGWGKRARALSDSEIHKLGSYYYPVWVYGYNWLQDNEESAKGLLERIDEIVAQYNRGKYFRCAGKVILVTHSMGGLVARRAAQMDEGRILGVVHGAQPVAGAPALYRRLRAGQEAGEPSFDFLRSFQGFMKFAEDGVTAAFMGWSEQSMAVQLARAPGPLELAPTKHYPPGWLVCAYGDDREIFSLPKKDPYAEIYGKTTDDCWWGMVNPAYIDPAGTIRKDKKKPKKEYEKAIKAAEKFHDRLGLYAHPETYGFYGTDDKEYRAFGKVVWRIQGGGTVFSGNVISRAHVKDAEAVKNAKAVKYGTGEVSILLARQADGLLKYRASQGLSAPPAEPVSEFKAILQSGRNLAGDGTVPADSGSVLERLEPAPQETFAFPGFDHQGAFKNPHATLAAIYFIARIVQKASPPTSREGLSPPC